MSNINKPFNENGPVIISEDDFKSYQSKQDRYRSIHQALIDWIIRPINNEGVRRLCLRDMLRQNYEHSCGYYDMDGCYTTVLHLDDLGGLYKALCKSEKHRTEFIEEAMYNIDHGIIPSSGSEDDDEAKTELFEFLIVLQNKFKTESIDANRLWRLHPLNQPKESLTQAWDDFEFCYCGMCLRINGTYTPSRFYAEIQTRFKATITNYIKECQDSFRQRGSVFSATHPFNPNLIGYIKPPSTSESLIIRLCQKVANSSISNFAEECIELLEKHLDPNISYLPIERIPKILTKLNTQLSYNCLKRHILLASEKELIETWSPDTIFLYWARGIITAQDSHQQECLNKINACLSH